jgi:hypothetical protein
MRNLPLSNEQHQKILDISQDFYRYARNNLWIRNKDAQIVPFEPNIAQRELIGRVITLLESGQPVRIIILKARQMGLSTAVEAIIYWWTTTHKNITSAIIAHEDVASKNLYNMFKRYYDNSNPLFKPSRKYDTRSDLTFALEDADGNQIGLNSVIKTATAKNTSAGRSDTIQLLHGSEVASWDNGEELVASLLQTVPVRPNTMIFLESTAEGRGNFFYKQWTKSVKGETVFEPFFFPWWIQDEYEMEGEDIAEWSPDEKDIIELMREGLKIGDTVYQISEDKIQAKMRFRRYKEREFAATPERLLQEYPSTAHEAFIASGQTVFNIKALSHMEKQCGDEKSDKKYTLFENQAHNVEVSEVTDAEHKKHTPLKIWDMPEPNEEYVIGADVAEGLVDGDYSVADIIRKKDMKTVARYRGHPDPDQFGTILEQLGRFYNYALVGVEINNHGLTTVQRLRNLFYRNLYRRERGMDEVFETMTSSFGWKTDMKTKPLSVDYLAEAIREGYIIDRDIVFVEEAYSYVKDDRGKTNAEIGSHDDTIMAKAIALQLWDWSENNKEDLKVIKPRKSTSRKRKHKMLK